MDRAKYRIKQKIGYLIRNKVQGLSNENANDTISSVEYIRLMNPIWKSTRILVQYSVQAKIRRERK